MAYESSKSSPKNPAAKPGASSKSSAKLAATSVDTKSGMPAMAGSEVTLKECDAIEAELAALRVTYDHYFMGIDRLPPTRTHEDLKKRLERLKSSFVRNTSAKFRVQAIHSKFVTYERLWLRTLQEIENGTYKRDLAKARRRIDKQKPAADKAQAQDPIELPDEDFEVEEVHDAPAPRVPVASATPSVASAVPGVAPAIPAVAPLAGAPARTVSRPNLPAAVPSVAPAAIPSGAPKVPGVAPAVPPVARAVAPVVPPLAPAVAPVVPPVARAVAPSKPPGVAPATPPRVPGVPSVAPAVAPVAARTPPPATRPVAQAATAHRPPSAASPGDLSDDKLKTVYDAYVAAKRRNKEDTSKMSYDTIAASLRKQVPELMKQHNAKAVEFKVVIKDGKAVLKAVPK